MYGLCWSDRYSVVYREYLIPLNEITAWTDLYSAGLFWASEGAVALGYPEPAKRGRYMK